MPFLRDTLGLGATPFFAGPAYGPSMLAAGVILAIMVLPYISAVSREVLAGGAAVAARSGAGAWARRNGR